MANEKRLVLHVGIPKTGSTALQIAFTRNRPSLAKMGVHYPAARNDAAAMRGRLVSGNGVALLSHMTAEQHDPAVLDSLRAEIRDAPAPSVLFSSEALFRSRPERVRELVDAVRSEDFDVKVVAFVRDLAGHALSSYSEMVKGALLTTTFAEYVKGRSGPIRYRPALRGRLEPLLSLLGPGGVTVLHYESNRKDLLGALMRSAFGLEDVSSLELPDAQVNRSMTADELLLMRHVNERLGDVRTGRRISDAMIARPPIGSTRATISTSELAALTSVCAPEVAWVNDTFFGGEILRLDGGAALVDDPPTEREMTESERSLVEELVTTAHSAEAGKPMSGSPM